MSDFRDKKSNLHHAQTRSTDDSKPPLTAAKQDETSRSRRGKGRKLSGWRRGVAVSALLAIIVLVFNIIFTIVAVSTWGTSGGIGTAYSGNCETVNRWSTWLHVLINALSSILLSASNYAMQCACSPTRDDINKAHAKGDWMDIGVPSWRNIWRISWRRSVLWWLLALSSIPLHLLYNSAIFKTITANEYTVALVNPGFLSGQPFAEYTQEFGQSIPSDDLQTLQNVQANVTRDLHDESLVANLSNSDCIAAYASSYVSDYGNLLLVSSAQGNQSNETLFWYQDYFFFYDSRPEYAWMCLKDDSAQWVTLQYCDTDALREDANSWTVNGESIEYCLAEKTSQGCKLQFSLGILLAVIVANACKSVCMLLLLSTLRGPTIVTIGDALASFLKQPDELTKGRCLMGKSNIHKGHLRWKPQHRGFFDGQAAIPGPIAYYAPLRRRWFAAASITRWCTTMGLSVAALIAGSVMLAAGVQQVSPYLLPGQNAFDLPFGAVNSDTMLSFSLHQSSNGLTSAVLLANSWQAIVSFLYLTYNSLLTCMLLADEYSKYGNRRKPLRVSHPQGKQRSTYYLNLPFTYSVPLTIASCTLHWLVSQSIFLAAVDLSPDGSDTYHANISGVGFSCLPILLVLILGSCMLLAALGLGFCRFKSHIPVAGSSSVALAAATHRPVDDVDAAYLPVQWGEVKTDANVGHCCFTSEEVLRMEPGKMYAGIVESIPFATVLGEEEESRS